MTFIEEIKQRAKQDIKTIVLPEAEDIRILQATEIALKEKYANIVLIGNKEKILEKAKTNKVDIEGAKIIEPEKSQDYEKYVNLLYELRKAKGMTIEKSKRISIKSCILWNVNGQRRKLKSRWACFWSNPLNSRYTKTSITNLKNSIRYQTCFCFFVMVVPNCEYGANGTFIFADSGLNPDPNAEELSEIAISSSKSFKN